MSSLQATHSNSQPSLFTVYREAFVVKCECGACGPDDLQDALADGWRDIELDDSDVPGSHEGLCPECR